MVSPERAKLAYEYAFMPTGQSSAAAIVCCCLFFIFALIVIGNWIYTKYSWYDFLLISCLFRTVSLGVRSAYLWPGHYRPALQGVFLAFYNAGYGVNNVALLFNFAMSWLPSHGVTLYPRLFTRFSKYVAFFLILCIIAFGPCCGSIAAFLEYGEFRHPSAAVTGEQIRLAATYGLLSCNFASTVLQSIWVYKSLTSANVRAFARQQGKTLWHRKDPRLLGISLLCSTLLMVRGGTGVAGVYPTTGGAWLEDKKFYTLDTLFEYIVLCILCYPTLFPRLGCVWPREIRDEVYNGTGKGVQKAAPPGTAHEQP